MTIQIAKIMFHTSIAIMKKTLDLVSFKVGKESEEYKFYKKEIMDYFYNGLKDLFTDLVSKKAIERCSCNANLRHGFKPCEKCGGSGYQNRKTDK